MRIIYCDPDGDVIYTRIARIDMTQETDLTLNSLPVNTISVDIVTQDTLERGVPFYVDEDDPDEVDHHWFDYGEYYITKTQRIDGDRLRVEGMSVLGFLDWWTVGAEHINTNIAQAIHNLFHEHPKSGYFSAIAYYLDDYDNYTLDGFAPEQTARERLLWLCLAGGLYVDQLFDALVFKKLPDFSNYNYNQGTLISWHDTYWRPEIQMGDPVYEVSVEFVNDVSTTETYSGMNSGTDENGTTWYWGTYPMGYVNPENVHGREIRVQGVSLMHFNYQQPPAALIQALYQNRMEITLDIIYQQCPVRPGDVVRVYTAPDKIYNGYVQRISYTFGQMTKARLTINAHPEALPTQTVRVLYTAGGMPLGQRTEVYPEFYEWEIDNPEINGYKPLTPSISHAVGGTYVVDYIKIPLVWIEAHNGSFTEYTEGADISYQGLLVLGWQTEKSAATQIPWNNGGRWLDGRIPAEALTLPVQKAVYDNTKPAQDIPNASIQTIPVQYIDPDTGTVYEDTFNVIVYKNTLDSIRIEVPPAKVIYDDGDYIDYGQMVVKAYNTDGELWTDKNHPDGIIPLKELTLQRRAIYDTEQEREYGYVYQPAFDVSPWPNEILTAGYRIEEFFKRRKDDDTSGPDKRPWYNWTFRGTAAILMKAQPDDIRCVLIVAQDPNASGHERYAFTEEQIEWYGTKTIRNSVANNAWTYNGLTVNYFMLSFDATKWDGFHPFANEVYDMTGYIQKSNVVAWTLLYGQPKRRLQIQDIAVTWTNAGKTLTDTFMIMVGEATT